jgi:hypothetical protein
MKTVIPDQQASSSLSEQSEGYGDRQSPVTNGDQMHSPRPARPLAAKCLSALAILLARNAASEAAQAFDGRRSREMQRDGLSDAQDQGDS